MTIRETAIAKLQQLPESLVQEISDFIDFITRNHQAKTVSPSLEGDRSEAWVLQKPGFLQRWWAIALLPGRTPVSQTPAIALEPIMPGRSL